ncbi:MAG TPA: hypothetical protein VFR37_16645 [Longimicrobium sp.]|nr:hypothetical protein [Longimicrobium sp.]
MSSSNTVTLTSSLIQSVTYVNNSLHIKSGESYTVPPTITQSGSTWTIVLDADRSGDNTVADDFNNEVGGAYHEYAPSGGGTGNQPGSLNFWFGVTVAFNVGGNVINETFYLAQGNYSLTNNWWIGGNHVVNTGTPTYLVINGNNIQQILNLSGGTSSFTFNVPG